MLFRPGFLCPHGSTDCHLLCSKSECSDQQFLLLMPEGHIGEETRQWPWQLQCALLASKLVAGTADSTLRADHNSQVTSATTYLSKFCRQMCDSYIPDCHCPLTRALYHHETILVHIPDNIHILTQNIIDNLSSSGNLPQTCDRQTCSQSH